MNDTDKRTHNLDPKRNAKPNKPENVFQQVKIHRLIYEKH